VWLTCMYYGYYRVETVLTDPSQGLVERLESRLRDVESRLAAVEQPQPQPASVTVASSPQSSAVKGLPLLEGDPSFAAQSLRATERVSSAFQEDDPSTPATNQYSRLGQTGKI
jgi:hypothetical protein